MMNTLTNHSANYNVSFTNEQGFELAQRAAKLLSATTLVPKEYQNNMANCAVALNIALRIGADPLMVMQNLIIIHGKPTWSSQFLIATFNTCGKFSAIRYEFFGEKDTDSFGCRAWAIEKSTNDKIVGTDITIALAKKENWYGKNGSKWQTMPQQMLMYRAAAWLVRAYAPEISMGLHTADEANDIIDIDENGEVKSTSKSFVKKDEVKPFFLDDKFQDEAQKYKSLIESGKKTAEQIIYMLESKYTLTAEQKNTILKMEKDHANG